MSRAYTKEFLIDAFASRYEPLGEAAVESQRKLAEQLWDRVSKDEFRKYCVLDAEAIRLYKQIMQ